MNAEWRCVCAGFCQINLGIWSWIWDGDASMYIRELKGNHTLRVYTVRRAKVQNSYIGCPLWVPRKLHSQYFPSSVTNLVGVFVARGERDRMDSLKVYVKLIVVLLVSFTVDRSQKSTDMRNANLFPIVSDCLERHSLPNDIITDFQDVAVSTLYLQLWLSSLGIQDVLEG
jgi:hypothetical protein